jgi:hypothetical protein
MMGKRLSVDYFVSHKIGSPTTLPKPRGKSPGWTKGQKRVSRKTYPIAKKGQSHSKKSNKKAA